MAKAKVKFPAPKGSKTARKAKAQAEKWIRRLHDQGWSQREIARRGTTSETFKLTNGTVFNVTHPELHRGGLKESEAERILGRLKRDQRMMLPINQEKTVLVEPLNPRERKKMHEWYEAVEIAHRQGDLSRLKEFRGKSVWVSGGRDKKTGELKKKKILLLDDRNLEAIKGLVDSQQLDPEDYVRYDRPLRRMPGSRS